MSDTAGPGHNSVVGDELTQFIERWEHLDVERKDIVTGQRDLMAEAKGRGYDPKVMRKLIAERKRDADDLAEEQAVLEMYREAMRPRTPSIYPVSPRLSPDGKTYICDHCDREWGPGESSGCAECLAAK